MTEVRSQQALAQPEPELIPRRALFGIPSCSALTLSPDGRWLAFLAPWAGVQNVWIAPVGDPQHATPLSAATGRPVADFIWSPDSKHVLYRQDEGGTENFQLFGVALADRRTINYTPFPKAQATIVRVSPSIPDAILIGLNDRDPRWHDVHRLDPATGDLTLVWRNPSSYARVIADPQLRPVLARRIVAGGGAHYDRLDENGHPSPLFGFGLEDSLSTSVLSAVSESTVHLLDSRDRDTSALSAMDLVTGETRVIAEDRRVDIGGSIKHPLTGEILAYAVEHLTRRWVALNPETAADIAALDRETNGQWAVTSQSNDNRLWTIAVDRAAEPTAFLLYDRAERRLTPLYDSRPELQGKRLAVMRPVEIPARDGLTLVSYLTLPPGADSDGDGVPDRPVPLVLLVHGGPWGRDTYRFDNEHQWLATRGYAVLAVNFRASTGFGKAFVGAGDLEWGAKMQDDLLDAMDWAVKAGVTTVDAVAIMGGSYGGYATLVGVAMTPDVFRCGLEIVGPSNLLTLLETVPPYWGAIYEQFAHRMGDPRTEAGRDLLKERSPVHHAHRIKVPLLIGQGANDARVNRRESDQIVAAMKANGVPVTYILYPDEGHGVRRPENSLPFYAVAEAVLAACMGGACEPVGADFDGSSLEVLEGAELIDSLAAAARTPDRAVEA